MAYVCGRLTFVGETMGLFPRWPRLLCAGGQWGGVFLLVYRLVESIYLLCLAVSRLKGV